MTHSTPFLADFIRGITATAPPAEDEERIEWHSAQQQGLLPEIHVFHRRRSDPSTFTDTGGECFAQAAQLAPAARARTAVICGHEWA